MTELRTCTKCGKPKPLDEAHYYRRSYPKEHQFNTQCIECCKRAVTAWKQRRRDHVNAYQRKRAKALRDGTWGT